jgi:hypothetical protein
LFILRERKDYGQKKIHNILIKEGQKQLSSYCITGLTISGGHRYFEVQHHYFKSATKKFKVLGSFGHL